MPIVRLSACSGSMSSSNSLRAVACGFSRRVLPTLANASRWKRELRGEARGCLGLVAAGRLGNAQLAARGSLRFQPPGVADLELKKPGFSPNGPTFSLNGGEP